MFTGIIEEIGSVKAIDRGSQSIRLTIKGQKVLTDTRIGDSIAVNGICLTVTTQGEDWFSADGMPETMRRTGMQQLKPRDPVNLERAMQMGGRLGGHLVSGHIDGTGRLASRAREDNAIILAIEAAPEILRYIITKGSVALDGVSLTVVRVDPHSFQVSLIPHTAGLTILGNRAIGDLVNIECDVIGKYVERLMQPAQPEETPSSGLTWQFLEEHGF
jgi:riboflavin synthase